MVQISLECAGPQRHSGASPMFIHCVVLVFFLISSTKHDTDVWNRKNSLTSRTMQCINSRLAPFYHMLIPVISAS